VSHARTIDKHGTGGAGNRKGVSALRARHLGVGDEAKKRESRKRKGRLPARRNMQKDTVKRKNLFTEGKNPAETSGRKKRGRKCGKKKRKPPRDAGPTKKTGETTVNPAKVPVKPVAHPINSSGGKGGEL